MADRETTAPSEDNERAVIRKAFADRIVLSVAEDTDRFSVFYRARTRIKTMKRSDDPPTRRCALILEGFDAIVRREGTFYLRFCTLAPLQVEILETLSGISGDAWRVFRRICTFFRV